MSKLDIIKQPTPPYSFKTNVELEGIDDPKAEFVNKFSSNCAKRNLIVGTENGMILIYDYNKKQPIKKIMGEPWISTLRNDKNIIWLSGVSRSLIGLRIKDSKKIFHTNCGTKIDQYDGNLSLFYILIVFCRRWGQNCAA